MTQSITMKSDKEILPNKKYHVYLRIDRNGKFRLADNVMTSDKRMWAKSYIEIELDPNDAHCLIHTVIYKP